MDRSNGPGDSSVGHEVVAANGEVLGTVRGARPHYLIVARPGSPAVDLDVPMRAVAAVEAGRIVLRVNREALTEVPGEDRTAARRLDAEE